MINFANKMPVTKVLLFFSCLIVSCGVGIGVGSLWMLFKFKDINSLIYGLLILIGSLFLAALIRMFADIGQIMFDLRVDIQRSFKQTNELDQKLNKELRDQSQLQADALNQNLQLQSDVLNQKLQLRAGVLSQGLQAIIDKLDKSSYDANELDGKLNQELKDQLQLQAGALNQDLQTIIGRLDKSSHDANELVQRISAIKDNFNQMNLNSKDMNQNINQIRIFFERIEKHLDLNK